MNNIEVYNKGLENGLIDKLFFLDKIEFDFMVDYGCANGALIKAIDDIMNSNNKSYLGYDISSEMVDIARHNCNRKNVHFTNEWGSYNHCITEYTSVLVLSSVIHEVYSYSKTKEDIDIFWKQVFESNFKYIVIRDMLPYNNINKNIHIHKYIFDNITNTNIGKRQYIDYINIWCNGKDIDNALDFNHFLLKYKYIENWEREVKENYFPLYLNDLLNIIYKYNNYNINYLDSYILPYYKKWVLNEIGYNVMDNTHAKLILKLK